MPQRALANRNPTTMSEMILWVINELIYQEGQNIRLYNRSGALHFTGCCHKNDHCFPGQGLLSVI